MAKDIIRVHLGCGPHPVPEQFADWDNYDINPGKGGIKRNLVATPLPYDNGTVDFIFSEHFLEHITRDEALQLLRECHRVLRPKSTIRTTVPSLEFLLDAYFKKDITRWAGAWQPKTPCQMVNYGMTSWGHRFTYDTEELILLHKEAGFEHVKAVAHGKYEVRGWSGEISVEATK